MECVAALPFGRGKHTGANLRRHWRDGRQSAGQGAEIEAGATDEQRRRILWQNAAELYGVEEPAG